ncbi:hypothetical protein ACS96_28520 [Pseudomonas aeruginosa]|nr:hypothetical protein ACS96_28515 [Pseudomonas aeruginosa]KMQ53427.1 hypothetical protein ACS96_28520 [Pseudomonas aeruginosa]
MASSSQYGSVTSPHIGIEARHSSTALPRISQLRSRRSDSQPSGHCAQKPATMHMPTKKLDCEASRPLRLA